MMYGVHIFSSGTKAHQRTRPVRIKHLVTWPHWLSFHLSHCVRVAIRQALFSSMDGSVTVVITVYMGRICLCKYVRLMHGGLSGMSPIRPASLSSCQSHLNRTTGPEPDSNSSTDECVWVCAFIFCRLSLSFSPALVAYKDCGPRARPRGTSLFGEPIVKYHVQITLFVIFIYLFSSVCWSIWILHLQQHLSHTPFPPELFTWGQSLFSDRRTGARTSRVFPRTWGMNDVTLLRLRPASF